MTGPYSECQVRLHRDALNTPWGFRLQGGKDFKTPLTVQRVFVGSPADGDLHRGDIIVSIENYDTNNLTHKQAQDVIKNAGGSMSLRLQRGAGSVGFSQPAAALFSPSTISPGQYRSRALDSIPQPSPPMAYHNSGMHNPGMSFGSPAPPPNQDHMLNRVKNSLTGALWTAEDVQDADYEKKSIGDIKAMFSDSPQRYSAPAPPPPQAPQHRPAARPQPQPMPSPQNVPTPGYKPGRRQPWRKPEGDTPGLADPGWCPKPKGMDYGIRSAPYSPGAPTTPQAGVPSFQQDRSNRRENVRHSDPGKPAWSGSLRTSGGPKPWEIHAGEALVPGGVESNIPTGPSSMPRQAPESSAFQPQQHQPQNMQPHPQNVQPHSPRVQNVHYSPHHAPQYQQQASVPEEDSESARVVHSQYNSPLGLYSKDNVQKVLDAQTGGKPGAGTMQVVGGDPKKFNPAQSNVYRYLQEEEGMKQARSPATQHSPAHAQHAQSARYQEQGPGHEMQYHGHVDNTQKSPMMQALEHHVLDEGTSDF